MGKTRLELTPAEQALREAALEYHRSPTRGKISVAPTKPLANQRDLSLAYSPGVAYACLAIRDDPLQAATLTARANLVAVVSNGTAVLGLGNIGPLAGKPVMEGKACLFKKFAGIDVFDIELAATDPDRVVEIVAALEPTFGGINLEDIKAPECFYIERKLRERMKIPVFHDDQHGTAIIVGAALINALKVADKDIGRIKLVSTGAGAAGLACLDMLVSLGVKPENIWVADRLGVVWQGRTEEMDPDKARYARDTSARRLKFFPHVSAYVAAVPTYVGGFMTLGWAAKDAGLTAVPVETIRQRALIVILSDLFVEPEELRSCFQHLRFRKHDVAVFHLLDPQELTFSFRRPMRFLDMEGGPAIFAEPNEIADRYPGRALVGWYHTHPRMGVFLSSYDTWLHMHFFPEPWQVALVIEPFGGSGGFFIRQPGDRLDPHRYFGFHELLPFDGGSVVRWSNLRPEAQTVSSPGGDE